MERNQKLTPRAQVLRREMTKEEGILWHKYLRRYPMQFKRQYVIGTYIVDFYCHKAKLVVELDGSQHYEPEEMEYDRRRTAYLESQGLKVLRFTNLEITRQLNEVCSLIDMTAKERAET